MSNSHNYYIPHLRTGMAARVATSSQKEKRTSIKVSLDAKAGNQKETASLDIALYGPGDVLGFQQKAILRIQPVHNIGNFDASKVPFLEFAEPDFLWRYSTLKVKGNWVPWISLIVLKNKDGEEEGEFALLPRTNPNLPPRVKLSADAKLPDLKEAWRWAHIHVNGEEGTNEERIKNILKTQPHLAVARLMCARRLKPRTKYTALVVPTYLLGVEAGLGLDIETSETEGKTLAWSSPTAGKGMTIPYYYKWEFRTGTRGDFESLIKQLTPRTLTGVGLKEVDCSQLGYGLQAEDKMQFEGALRSTDTGYQSWGYDATATANETQEKLTEVLNSHISDEVDNNGEPILRVVPPIYGKWFQSEEGSDFNLDKQNNWINELNLDFRHRYAAGLGVEFVKENQETLMQSAWQQLKEIKKVNRALNVGKFGRAISSCMYKRLNGLSAEKLLQFGLPLQSKLRAENTDETSQYKRQKTNKPTIHAQLKNSEMTDNVSQIKLRKYLVRKFDKKAIPTTSIHQNRQRFQSVLKEDIVTSKFVPKGSDNRGNKENPDPIIAYRARGFDEMEQSIEALGNQIKKNINPSFTIEKRLCRKIDHIRHWERRNSIKEEEPQTRSLNTIPKDPLRPVMWYPEFHSPMYRYLRDKGQHLLLPGLGEVPENTVAVLVTNPRFIESFMLGLNHEFAAELRWREYPTDMRGTYFRKFWDTTIYSVDDYERRCFRASLLGRKLLEKLLIVQNNNLSLGSNQKANLKAYLKALAPNAILNKNNLDSNYEKAFKYLEGIFDKKTADLKEDDLAIAKIYEQYIENWLLTREQDKDMTPIHEWTQDSKLGDHPNIRMKEVDGQEVEDTDQVVLLIRGDILNKFPNMLLYLEDKATKSRVFPIFEANLDPDIVMLGFPIDDNDNGKYNLIFEEPMSEIQYGLDELVQGDEIDIAAPVNDITWQNFHIEDGYINKTIPSENSEIINNWDNPAFIAKVFTQKSVRVSMPLSKFFPNETPI